MSDHPHPLNLARNIVMMKRLFRAPGLVGVAALTTFALATSGTLAQESKAVAEDQPLDSAEPTLSDTSNFSEETGAALYASVCQACHMGEGQGAVGAGKYPALAKNENLEAGGYPVSVVVQGLKGMPPVGQMMSDEQVAAVVDYVRTHFGNNYKDDPVTAQDVADVR
ncbi:c-type cytochrome [Allomesorhizobium camelthorni]|nr:cytochrome c [Mesorhizobium camelthorni]